MTRRERRAYLGRLQQFGIKLGLDTITGLLDALGCPERLFPSVHVAGTNGKGSVAAMLERILRESGFRTGLYTSPHLVRVEERIRVDGRPVGPRTFDALLGRAAAATESLEASRRLQAHPTFFEVLTACGFRHFADRGVDIAVVEVGMGGRFDATNVLEPQVSVITTIAKDHERHLGSSLHRIAFEKAGIIKPGVPVVCGVRGGPALREIRRRALARHAPLVEAFGPGRRLEARRTAAGYRFRYSTGSGSYAFTPFLSGLFQGDNAAVAIAAAEVLSRRWRPLSKGAVLRGIRETRWEGRLEAVSRRPLVVLDGAHNEAAARSLAAYIRGVIGRKIVLVFAAMKDKDIAGMARALFPEARTLILTQVPLERSARPEDILAAVPGFAARTRLEPDPARAIKLALAESGGRLPVVVAGSLFLVGEVKRLGLFRP